ncbi:hypothetical protein GCM10027596_36120 [Nocardioides korecus]
MVARKPSQEYDAADAAAGWLTIKNVIGAMATARARRYMGTLQLQGEGGISDAAARCLTR